MEFKSQIFKAPSLTKTPKLKKTTFSSSIFSGISKSKYSGVDLEKISTPTNDNIASTLIETNAILVEIQKQLSYDFAMRIAEEKEKKQIFQKEKSRKRLKAEESQLEKSGKKIGGILKKVVDKTLSPIENIFSKLMNFVLTVGAGIATNAAFEWLSKEENREKLDKWFEWVGKNWKWIAATAVGLLVVKELGPIIGMIGGAIGILKTAFDLFNWARKKMFPSASPPPPPPPRVGGGTRPPVTGFSGGNSMSGRYRTPGSAASGGFRLEQQRSMATGTSLGKNIPKGGGGPQALLAFAAATALNFGSNFLFGKLRERNINSLVEKYNKLSNADKSKMLSKVRKDLQIEKDYAQSFGGKVSDVVDFISGGTSRHKAKISFLEEFLSRVEPREMGGPVSSESPYLVGERGPELFIPNINGSVVNNYKTEKIYQMISSKKKGRMNFIELPPIVTQNPQSQVSVPTGEATEVPSISSTNSTDPYLQIAPILLGITV